MPTKIRAQHVGKRFRSGAAWLQVVDDLDFEVGDGEFVAVVGPSGCGKTTLMNMLAGFMRPDSGAVLVDGRQLEGPGSRGILISQAGSMFPWLTVSQNLLFGVPDGRGDRQSLALDYVHLVGLEGFEHSYPHELSGGMLRRAELARALMVKPQVLYMDEPFSALDALTSLRLQNELLRILRQERHTVVLITHDVEEAIHLADRVLVLSPRPARIKASFPVPFAHPRRLASAEVQALRVAILGELGVAEAE